MAVVATPIFPQSVLSTPVQFNNSTSTSTPTTLLAAQTNGAKIESIMVSSNDSSSRDIQLFLVVSATNYPIGTVLIPATAGTVDTIPAVNLLSALSSGNSLMALPLDSNGNPYLYLSSVAGLAAEPLTTITSTKLINLVVTGGAF